jgi:lipopolysaccharide/colanic/teichoic acid biosynthesis glycosyltransferase
MEPDTQATTSDPLADTRQPGTDIQPPALRDAAAFLSAHEHVETLAVPAVLPGVRPHVNGHAGANGHGIANGNVNGLANGHTHHGLSANGEARAATWSSLVTPLRLAAQVAEGLAPPRHRAHAPAAGWYLRFGKRALDVVGAAAALAITGPLMVLCALVIKLESRGPVFYRSVRVGRGGRPFTFLKLRSMVDGADQHRHNLTHLNECEGPVFKISRDPRVTRIGRFLRTTSIDEIPNFLNVLRGDMSLVGPRPPLPEEVTQYEPWQMRRLDVRPGITCLWQISGRSCIGFREWMRLDLEYIRHQSIGLDVRILMRTLPAVLSREGAY